MEFENGEIYKIIGVNGNEFVGFAYKPTFIEKAFSKICFANLKVMLMSYKLNKKLTIDLAVVPFNLGISFTAKEIKRMVKLDEKIIN